MLHPVFEGLFLLHSTLSLSDRDELNCLNGCRAPQTTGTGHVSLSKDFVNSAELYQGTCSSPKQNEDVVTKNVRDLNGLVTLALTACAERILV